MATQFLCYLSLLSALLTISIISGQQFHYDSPSEVLHTADDRIRGARNRMNKDFVLGGLIAIHSNDPNSGGGQCGSIRIERGVERMEAMLFAIDLVNNDSELLKGLDIGYDIRDTCDSENIGLDETIDLIITGNRMDIQSCQSSAVGTNSTQNNSTTNPPTSGIVGAAASGVSIPVASLTRLFQTPQISYASTSAELSNRDRYEYFYRTIPPDNLQAQAMLDILLRFNWTYVSTIYSQNPYGEHGISEFRDLAAQNGICIDLDMGVKDNFDFDELANSLIASDANVVIVFANRKIARELLVRIANSTAATRFTWIASDGWARSIDVVHQANDTAAGLYGIAPLTDIVSQFHDYYEQLTIDSNSRNPWFAEYFAAYANCNLSSTIGEPCRTDQSVTEFSRYHQGDFIPLVIDAVYAYAHALQNFLDDNCQLPVQWNRANHTCVGYNKTLTGNVLLDYIGRLDFINPLTGNRIVFDSNGNVEGRYEIINYQASGDIGRREYNFFKAGIWDSSVANDSQLQALMLTSTEALQFGIESETRATRRQPQISQCGRCRAGEYRRLVQSSCCGICEPCRGRNYSSDPMSISCLQCDPQMWGNNPLIGSDSCVPIPKSFVRHSDPFSIVVMVLAVLGLITVGGTAIVYFIYWKTPVIKSSGREQMITLLIGIGLIFVLAFVYVSPPDQGVCAVQRMGFWICYSIIFGALLVKIVRVTRIFFRTTNLSRIRFTEPYYQVLFTSLIILGQVVIVIIGLIVVHPHVDMMIRPNSTDQNALPELVVFCVVDHVAILVICALYETILIVLSTILGILSFKCPEDFNEAKFVSFCTSIITIIWATFVGLYAYFAVEERQEIQNAITGLASVLSAYAVLVCLFGPKLFIVLFRSKQNKADKRVTGSSNSGTDITYTMMTQSSSTPKLSAAISTMSYQVNMAADPKSLYLPPTPTQSPRHSLNGPQELQDKDQPEQNGIHNP